MDTALTFGFQPVNKQTNKQNNKVSTLHTNQLIIGYETFRNF